MLQIKIHHGYLSELETYKEKLSSILIALIILSSPVAHFNGLTLTAVILLCLINLFPVDKLNIKNDTFFFLSLALLFWGALSLTWSIDIDETLRGIRKELIIPCFLILIRNNINCRVDDKLIFYTFCISCFILLAITSHNYSITLSTENETLYLYKGWGETSTSILIYIAIASYYGIASSSKHRQLTALILLLSLLASLFFTKNRMVWVAGVSFGVIIFLFEIYNQKVIGRKKLLMITLLTISLIALVITLMPKDTRHLKNIYASESLESYIKNEVRIKIWNIWINDLTKNHLTGSGYGYWIPNKFIEPSLPNELGNRNAMNSHAHNFLINTYVRIGFIGTFITCLIVIYYLYTRMKCTKNKETYFLGIISIALILSFGLRNMVDDFYTGENIYLLWITLLLLRPQNLRKKQSSLQGR